MTTRALSASAPHHPDNLSADSAIPPGTGRPSCARPHAMSDESTAAEPPIAERWLPLKYTLGEPLLRKCMRARVLVVGAGGIGCELLKDLVLTGVHQIEVIDLDTIDVSNLNRQFLFRPQHVGQPKALVAKEMVLKLNPDATIVAYHANIKTSQFGLGYGAARRARRRRAVPPPPPTSHPPRAAPWRPVGPR